MEDPRRPRDSDDDSKFLATGIRFSMLAFEFVATLGLIVLVPPLERFTFSLLQRRLKTEQVGLVMASSANSSSSPWPPRLSPGRSLSITLAAFR